MLTLNSDEIWKRAWSFKDHGKSYDAVHYDRHSPGYRWVHDSIGTNMRMTEMQAAIGRVTLRKVPDWLEARRRHAATLAQHFAGLPGLHVHCPSAELGHAYYKFYAFLQPEQLRPGWSRDRIMQTIQASGVPCFSGICGEIYLENAFSAGLRPPRRFPVARHLGETSLMFLVHPTLRDEHMLATAERVKAVMEFATV